MTISLDESLPTASSDLPGISNSRGPQPVLADGFLLGLAPDEVYRAIPVTRNAVSSYLAISPLPRRAETRAGRFAFCCTVCRVSAPGRYPASCPVVPGLSSSIAAGGHPLPARKSRNIRSGRQEWGWRSSRSYFVVAELRSWSVFFCLFAFGHFVFFLY